MQKQNACSINIFPVTKIMHQENGKCLGDTQTNTKAIHEMNNYTYPLINHNRSNQKGPR